MELNSIEKCYQELKAAGREPISLVSGHPGREGIVFPQEIIEQAYSGEALTSIYRPQARGFPAAREAIARFYHEKGHQLNPEHMILTSGTSEAFFYLFTLLAQPGDNFLVPYPSYPLFEHLAHYSRVELRPYFLEEARNWSWDAAALKDQINERTRGIVVISPHNPTGKVLNAWEWQQLAALAAERNLPIICDEVFSEFYYGEGDLPRGFQYIESLCFTLNGISKTLALPGHKLGWMALSGPTAQVEKRLGELELMADTFLTCNQGVQAALAQLLGSSQDFRQAYFAEVAERRQASLDQLKKIPHISFIPAQGGFYQIVFFEDPKGRGEEDFVLDFMRNFGYQVYPGYFFDLNQDRHFIFSFLTHPDHRVPGLQAIQQCLGLS